MYRIMKSTIVAAMLALPAVGLHAETRSTSLGVDPRIREYSYHPNTVYRLDVYMKFITSLQFASGEEVKSIQVGDSASWEIIRLSRGDVLSVKPLIAGAYTNMTVHTDRRIYTFELRARTAKVGSPEIPYRVSFRYPEDERKRRAAQAEIAARPKDYNYFAAGPRSIRPARVYDDGRNTYFFFRNGRPRPAVFRVDERGRESVVNVTQTKDGFAVASTSERWTLRLGDRELCIAHADVIKTIPDARSARAMNGR